MATRTGIARPSGERLDRRANSSAQVDRNEPGGDRTQFGDDRVECGRRRRSRFAHIADESAARPVEHDNYGTLQFPGELRTGDLVGGPDAAFRLGNLVGLRPLGGKRIAVRPQQAGSLEQPRADAARCGRRAGVHDRRLSTTVDGDHQRRRTIREIERCPRDVEERFARIIAESDPHVASTAVTNDVGHRRCGSSRQKWPRRHRGRGQRQPHAVQGRPLRRIEHAVRPQPNDRGCPRPDAQRGWNTEAPSGGHAPGVGGEYCRCAGHDYHQPLG